LDELSSTRPQQPGERVSGALEGLRVVELAAVLAGPLCGQTLADHGATVIKVEPPAGDQTRMSKHFVDGQPAYFSGVNRNKSCIALDLTREKGREVVLRLLESADVLLENFLPGTLARWGLDYPTLAQRFPRLIHCSISGFGADGPLGGKPGYDAMGQAYCGLMSVNGNKADGGTRHGIPIVDIASGLNAIIGILLALNERNRSGRGQFIDVSLFDSGLGLQHPYSANWFGSGIAPEPVGNGHPDVAPYNKFRARDGDIFIGAPKDVQFRRLAQFLNHPELAEDPRFKIAHNRVENKEALEKLLAPLIAQYGAEELADALMKVQVAAAPVYSLPQAFQAPHAVHRKMHVRIGDYQGIGIPVKLSRTPGSVRTVPRGYAADTDTVLAGLGYSEAEIAALIQDGSVRAPGSLKG
jgi:crotonobetainyl-CoA:carnitine CoA-transferase CaiB-like acyl-CoA transferase